MINNDAAINVKFESGAANTGPACIQPFDDGRLLLVFTSTESGVSRLLGRWSPDAGESWKPAFPIWDAPTGARVCLPSLIRQPSGRLVLLVRLELPNGGQALTSVSDDDGRNWTEPSPIKLLGAEWRFMNDSLVALRSGRLLLPVVHDERGCLTWISDDGGNNWRMGGGAVRPKEGETCREPTVTELPNGRVAMFLRTSNPANQIYIASSADGDAAWRFDNEWGPVSLDAPCLARRMPSSEDILLLWTNHCLATNLTSGISRGPLRFWEPVRVIEEQDRWPDGNTYSHPSLAFRRDQAHLTYVEREPSGAQRLIYRRLPVAWFRAELRTRPMVFDSRAYIKEIWEAAPADNADKYIREFGTATFNPADVRRKSESAT